MKITMTPLQFEGLEETLKQAPGVKLNLTSSDSGTLTTPDVTLAASYDGTDSLDLTVTDKHSLAAHFASESMIESHITTMINKYINS